MKNWKYIEGAKVGNESIASHPESLVAQEIYKIYLDAGKDEKKALETLSTKYKSIPKEALKEHLKDAIKAYASIVRNSKTGNGVFSIFKSDKPIKMKSPQGAIVTINPDGTAAHQDKEGSQMAVHPHNSFKEAVEYYKSQGYVKVGNESLGEYMAKKPRVINEEKTGAEEFFKQLSDDVKEREKKDDADIEKVGNFKTGTSALKPGDRVQSYGVQGTVRKVEGENSDNIYGEPIIEVEWDNGTVKKVGEHYLRKIGNKVGNKKLKFTDKKDGKIEYVYDEESKDGHIYYDGKLVDTKKAVGPGWVDLIKQKAFSSGVMNKTGNAFTSSDKKRLDELARKKPTQLTPQEWKEFQDLNKREEEASREMLKKSGNSASDDKFAYVMREFDEGKLKTPDGKVVTDPAQAKAIAYSESKKTENGLARARNAMNKRCGNSQVTLWKGNDSVLISEDGTVQYLESNSFETDRDKYGSMQEAIDDLTKKGYRKK